jgi:hypothetical protein
MGTGWNLAKAVEDTFSVYVKSAVVENGVVTMTSKNISVGGRDSFTLILVPQTDSGSDFIKWSVSPESTCRQADLC